VLSVLVRSESCEELAKQLRAKWELRTTLIPSQSDELWKVDAEVARLIALVQEACGTEGQKVIEEIFKARV
jgi:pyruvate-formate lyase-activating enzyme